MRHHENYGAAALGGGVGILTSNLSISDICFDISNSILGTPRGRWKNFQKREKLIFRRIKKNESRRSERENRVGFPGRANICVQKGFEEEEEQKKEEENASSRSKNSKNDSRRKSKTKKRKTLRRILLRCTMNFMVRRRREAASKTSTRIGFRRI